MKSLLSLLISCSAIAETVYPSSTLQSRLDALTNMSVPSMTINISRGLYVLDSPLRVPPTLWPNNPVLGLNSGIHIKGDGMASTQLYWPASAAGLLLTNGSYEGVTIEDLTLIGPMTNSASIGLIVGVYSSNSCFAGQNNAVRNCAFMGWGTGAACTNQWTLTFDNCVVVSNTIEGLRFAACHGVNVNSCRIMGGWTWACGTGVGFHAPLNWCFGDNAQIQNCLIGRCTNGILNSELNLLSSNNHLETCGSYYTLVSSTVIGAGSPFTTIIGGYTLDQGASLWTNGFAAQVLMDVGSAQHTYVIGCAFNGGWLPPNMRPAFNVTNIAATSVSPTVVGSGGNSVIYTIDHPLTNVVPYRAAVPVIQ